MKRVEETFDPLFYRLSGQTRNILFDSGIEWLEDLATYSPAQLKSLEGIGPKRYREIVSLLEAFQLYPEALSEKPQSRDARLSETILSFFNRVKEETESWKKGRKYIQQDRINHMEEVEDGEYRVEVRGSELYRVTLKPSEDSWDCNCSSIGYWGPCKHAVAATIHLVEKKRKQKVVSLRQDGMDLLEVVNQFRRSGSSTNGGSKEKMIHYVFSGDVSGEWTLVPRVGPESPEGPVDELPRVRYGQIESANFPGGPRDRVIIERLSVDYQGEGVFQEQHSPSPMGDVIPLLTDHSVYLVTESGEEMEVNVSESELHCAVELRRWEMTGNQRPHLRAQFRLKNENGNPYSPASSRVISKNPLWVCVNDRIHRVRGGRNCGLLLESMEQERYLLDGDKLTTFLQQIVPELEDAGVQIELNQSSFPSRDLDPDGHIYLDEHEDNLSIELRYAYGNQEVGPGGSPYLLIPDPGGDGFAHVERDRETEEAMISLLTETGLQPVNGKDNEFEPEEDPIEWLMEAPEKLPRDRFSIFGKRQLSRYSPPVEPEQSSLRVSGNIDWFSMEGEVDFGGDAVDLSRIRDAVIEDRSYVELSGGEYGKIPDEWIEEFSDLLEFAKKDGDHLQMPRGSAPVIDEMLEEVDEADRDETFASFRDRMSEFSEVEEIDPPQHFEGKLRPYQKAGLSWLWFLREHSFGGILADDMGLGKTVQVLALLQKIREKEGDFPETLVVAPRSVLANWASEVDRFLDNVDVYTHHGSDRIRNTDDWPSSDVSITTYATMRRDIEWLQTRTFDYIVLDESQAIRNPDTDTSRAARLLSGNNRLCLSGTPVQNTVMDLWAQFEYLNPGYLGSRTRFEEQFVRKIQGENGEDLRERLRNMIDPFICRRTKKEVGKDLPGLTRTTLECPMTPQQRELYEQVRRRYRRTVEEESEAQPDHQTRMKTLEGLTRLRQICCHPDLVGEGQLTSSKIERFRSFAREVVADNHRALVFSQFVEFLQIIENEVQEQGWSYEYLDGSTRNREECVRRFQERTDIPFFLISLKAGGEGLNLTAADYVLMMDPWWNPAVEKQARDRTHRIGQSNQVFMYRLVCPDSIEEKILRLQERKAEIARDLITPEPGVLKDLSRSDLLELFSR